MNNKTNDIWFNIYVFLLLPFCILANIINLIKYISHFNYLDNLAVTIAQLVLTVIAIIYFAYTFYYAKDRREKAYKLVMFSIFYSILIASFGQVIDSYYNLGFKTYAMFFLYLVLFTACYGLPNYVYFKRRKDMFKMKHIINKEELKNKLEEIKKNSKKTNTSKSTSQKKKTTKKTK